jgi:hypothetical protein
LASTRWRWAWPGARPSCSRGCRATPPTGACSRQAFPAEARQGEAALYSLSTLTKAWPFERSLLSFNSPYDRYKYGGEPQAISKAAKRGEALFFGEKMECYHCHGGFTFNDNVQHSRLPFPEFGYHNTGLYNVDGQGSYPADNPGIGEFTGEASRPGRFRTASLRNVAVTAPYMHDGSIATLEDVIRRHYALAGRSTSVTGQPSPMRSELLVGFEVSDDEVNDLVAFLQALTDHDLAKAPRSKVTTWSTCGADADPLAHRVVVVRGHVRHQRLAAGQAQGVEKLRAPEGLAHDLRLHRRVVVVHDVVGAQQHVAQAGVVGAGQGAFLHVLQGAQRGLHHHLVAPAGSGPARTRRGR